MKKSNHHPIQRPLDWRKLKRRKVARGSSGGTGYYQTLSQSQRNEFGRILDRAVLLYRCEGRASALTWLQYMRPWLADYVGAKESLPASGELLDRLLANLEHPLFQERQS